ncbi:MAG: O-antigen ligase family protein [Eubacteriales bacterium]|nr:O-antigen ligase family protein [Eubacteriales bacterium]
MANDSNDQRSKNYFIEYFTILCIFCRLGFPGNYTRILGGENIRILLDYGISLLQMVIMLFASGDTLSEIKLLDLKRKYRWIYVMLAVITVISLMVTDNRGKQMTIIIRFMITALFGLWMADYYNAKRILEIFYYAQIGIIIANLASLLLFSSVGYYVDDGYGYIFRGIYMQKNGLGAEMGAALCLQTAFACLKRLDQERMSRIFILSYFAEIFLMLVSQSTSSMISAIITCLYLIYVFRKNENVYRIQWGISYTSISVGFLFASSVILPIVAPFLESLGKDATLSNRTPMWKNVINFMQKSHTMTGYGLLQFWENPEALKALQRMFSSNSWYRTMDYGAHNVILEMWLDIGLVGIAVFFLTMISCFHRVKEQTIQEYILCSAIMLPQLMEGVTDRMYTNVGYATCFLFICLGVACKWQNRKTRYGTNAF